MRCFMEKQQKKSTAAIGLDRLQSEATNLKESVALECNGNKDQMIGELAMMLVLEQHKERISYA